MKYDQQNQLIEEHADDKRQLQQRAEIEDLENSLRQEIEKGTLEQAFWDGATEKGDDQCEHYFAEGVYARGLWIPKDSLVVGRLHLKSRVCIIAAGKCRWVDEFSNGYVEVEAPWVGEFNPGSKTAVYAIEDTYWIAVVGTELKNPIEILKNLTVSNYEEYQKLLGVEI